MISFSNSPRSPGAALLLALPLALQLACGGEKADTSDGGGGEGQDTGAVVDPATVPLRGTCPLPNRWGGFTVDRNDDYAAVSGQVADGVVPIAVLTELLTEGECTIWRRENPFCDGGCDPGTTCGLDGSCVPYPSNQQLGTVRVAGLLTPVEMEPVMPGATYFDTSLSNPPWEPGALVALETGGGAWDAMTLFGVAPPPLVPETLDWQLTPGEPFTVRWTPPPSGSRGEVLLRLRVDQHGLTPSALECHFTDDGEGEVPASVFNALVEFGLTGFPAGDLSRQTVDNHAIEDDGCMDFTLSDSHLAAVSVEGYTPCNRDEECPEGQSCNVPLQRCE